MNVCIRPLLAWLFLASFLAHAAPSPDPERAINQLIAQLNDRHRIDQTVAALVAHGPDIITPLLAALDSDEGWRIEWEALRVFLKVHDRRVTDYYLAAIHTNQGTIALCAAHFLGERGETQAIAPLIRALQSSTDWNLRALAARSLAQINTPQAIIPLSEALWDPHEAVRRQAAASLDQLKWQPADDRERAAHRATFRDWDACVALGPPAVDALAVAIELPGVPMALARIGDDRSLHLLLDRLSRSSPAHKATYAKALAKMDHPQARAAIADYHEQTALIRKAGRPERLKQTTGRIIGIGLTMLILGGFTWIINRASRFSMEQAKAKRSAAHKDLPALKPSEKFLYACLIPATTAAGLFGLAMAITFSRYFMASGLMMLYVIFPMVIGSPLIGLIALALAMGTVRRRTFTLASEAFQAGFKVSIRVIIIAWLLLAIPDLLDTW